MKITLKNIFTSLSVGVLLIAGILTVTGLLGGDALAVSTADNARDGVRDVSGGNTVNTDLEDIIRIIINMLLFLVGVVAVVMLIIGGFRYVTSQGDSSHMTTAKNTILYAVIGLVVAIAAFAIVNFVLDQFI